MNQLPRRSFIRNTIFLTPAFIFKPTAFFTGEPGTLRVAFAGTGLWGQLYLRAALQQGNIAVMAVCDPSKTALEQARRHCRNAGKTMPAIYEATATGYASMLNRKDIDAVIICAPWHQHYVLAKKALLAGKHVACGPVMGNTLQEIHDIVQTSIRCSRQYVLLDEHSSTPEQMSLEQLIRNGALGKLQTLHAGLPEPVPASGVHKDALHYPAFSSMALTTALHAGKDNRFASVCVQPRLHEIMIPGYNSRTRTSYLRVTKANVKTICVTTLQQQQIYLQYAREYKDSAYTLGFTAKGSEGYWLGTGKLLCSTSMGHGNWVAEPGNVYLQGQSDNYPFLSAEEESSTGMAAALQQFTKAVQPDYANRTVFTAAYSSAVHLLARASEASGGRAMEFPAWLAGCAG